MDWLITIKEGNTYKKITLKDKTTCEAVNVYRALKFKNQDKVVMIKTLTNEG